MGNDNVSPLYFLFNNICLHLLPVNRDFKNHLMKRLLLLLFGAALLAASYCQAQPYLISYYKYNPQTVIATLKMPVLILQGKKDIQVQAEDATLLKQASPRAELVLIDKMNHVLKDCESTAPQQQMAIYNNPTLPLNTALRDAIVRFIERNQ